MPVGAAVALLAFLGAGAVGRMLSEEPRLEHRLGLLSVADARALRRLARDLGLEAVQEAAPGHPAGGEDFAYLNRSSREGIATSRANHPGWEACRRFEAAAEEWARFPRGNATAVVSRWDTWAPGTYLNRSGILHLDARMRSRNRLTVMAYLGSSGPEDKVRGGDAKHDVDSGFTVFPCIETEDMDAKEVSRRHKLCSKAHRHVKLAQEKLLEVHAEGLQLPPSKQFDFLQEHPELTTLPRPDADGARSVNWMWTAAHDAVAESPGAIRADPLFAIAEAMCSAKAPGLRIAAAVGAAVLFETAAPSGTHGKLVPNWQLWHAGCSPSRSHGRRWTVQLFFDDLAAGRAGEPVRGRAATQQCAVNADSRTCRTSVAQLGA